MDKAIYQNKGWLGVAGLVARSNRDSPAVRMVSRKRVSVILLDYIELRVLYRRIGTFFSFAT